MVERAFSRQSLAAITRIPSAFALQIALAAQQRQQRIGAQLIMVIEVFVSQTKPVDSLSKQFSQTMFYEPRISQIGEALRESLNELLTPFSFRATTNRRRPK